MNRTIAILCIIAGAACGPAKEMTPGSHCIVGNCQDGFGHEVTNDDNGNKNLEYIGGFRNGKFDGQGTLNSYSHGQLESQTEGIFREGREPVNVVIRTYLRGSLMAVYRGGYEDGRFSGQGTIELFERNGFRFRRYTGQWRNGVEHGLGEETDAEGNVKAGRWQDGTFVDN